MITHPRINSVFTRAPHRRTMARGMVCLWGMFMLSINLTAAPTLVQTTTAATGGNANTITATFASTPAQGNLLIAIAGNAAPNTVPTIPAGWLNAGISGATTPGHLIFYRIAGPSEPTSLTINYSSSCRLGLHLYEYSGMPNATLNSISQNSGSGASMSLSLTTSAANCLIVAGFVVVQNTSYNSWTNGFTEQNNFVNSGAPSSAAAYGCADRHVTSSGTYNTTATVGAGGPWYGQIAAFSYGAPPILDPSKSPVLGAQIEDAGAPVGAVGSLVSSLVDFTTPVGGLDNVTDPDAGAQLGIAVVGANTANGSWHYTINGGTNWFPLGAVSDASARLLAADLNTRLYFQPNANYHGSTPNAITFRAWDQTAGTNGSLMAVPAGSETVLDNCNVSSYSNNDGTQNWTGDWAENDNGGGGFGGGDIDMFTPYMRFKPVVVGEWLYREANLAGATSATLSFDMIYNILNPGGQVQIQISGDGGSSYTTLTTITDVTALGVMSFNITAYAAANTRFRLYASGASASGIRLDYVRIDLTRATAFSLATDVAAHTVTPIADTPSITNASTNEDTQSTSGLVISRNIVDGAEVTHFKITGITNGALYLNDGVTPVPNGTFVTFAQGNAGLRFTPSYNFSGSGSFTVQASTSNVDPGLGGSTVIATITVTGQPDLQGVVFEDVNYGGGSGRDPSTAIGGGGTVRQNARVELYDGSGNFVTSTLTNASGVYTFDGLAVANYTVRVVNSTVSSARAGYVANTHLAVQTFRTNASSGSVLPLTDRVGGEVPGKADAGNGSTTLAALTTATTTPQSITSVALGSSNLTTVDFGFSYNVVVNKNDTGQGSLRQLITNMNALSNAGLAIQGRTAGIDHGIFMLADGVARPGLTVTFATMFASGAATITPLTPLPSITTPMVLDASTHPLFTIAPIIEINGTSAGAAADGFTLAAGSTGSTIKGFVINRFLGDGIQLNAGGNTIQGNYIGVNVAGTAALANTLTGINIVACANNVIGGTATGQGNTISGNGGSEINISGGASTGNSVLGNYIGTRYNGTSVIASAGAGILIANTASGNTIGGTVAGSANVIGGNAQAGIEIKDAGTSNNTVAGNFIGTNASDAGLGNTLQGVKFQLGATNNTIGGAVPGSGNVIAYNGAQGVALFSLTDAGNRILGNSIHDNTLLGIDLGNDGVSYNDNGDADTGPNARQNFPRLTSAMTLAGNTTITGTFSSTSNTNFRVEYFSSPIGDLTGYGEGSTFLGTNNITTNAAGTATINATFTGVTVPSGYAVCATATNLTTNNTSEFSAFAAAPTDSDNDGVTNDVDIDDDNDGIPDDIEDLGFDSRGGTIACTQPTMNFQNPVLDAGTANTPGAIYRFSNVLPGIDARLSILAMTNASLVTVDDAALGTPDSWQPVIDFTGIGAPGIDFNMSFVLAGTATPATTITRFGGTTYDVDGVGEVESFLFTSPSVYAVDQPTLLVAQSLPGGLVDISGDGATDAPGISSDPRYRAYFQYKNTNQFNFRCQYKRTSAGTTQRYLSLRFNECFLNDLVNVQLYIVDGLDTDGDGVPDYLDLDSDNDGIYDVVEAGSGQPQTNGVLNGGVTTSGLKVAVDANLNNAIDYTLRDSDGDNIYDGVEQDSDGDGCFDVTEAGFIDQNADGRLGNDPVLVNGRGVVISGSGGYTTPADANANTVFDYREISAIGIICPGNITATSGVGLCTGNVTVPAPVVTSPCRGYTVSNSFNGTSDASGVYPLGVTTVTFIVTDATGGSASCTMTVTVNDVQSPGITCPANVSVNANPGQCAATAVALGTPTTIYGCDVATVTNNALASYPVGTTPVTWTLSTEDIPGYSATALIPTCVPSNAFPGPVNSTGGNISLSSSIAIYNTVANRLTTPGLNGSSSALCDGIACTANGATASTLAVTPGLGSGAHGALNTGTTISVPRQYTSVNIPNDALLTINGNRIIRCQGMFQMGTNSTLSINGDVVIHTNDFNADNDFSINVVSGSLVIISGNDFNVGNRARFTAPSATDLLVLAADDVSIQVDFIGKGMLYATDRIQFWPNSLLYGAMTGNNVQMLPGATVFGLSSGYYCLPTYLDPPQIINALSAATNTISYPENATSALMDLQTDDNNSSEGSGLSYSLSGADAGDFTITAATGILSFAATPNFEAPVDANLDNIYQVTVTVTDIDGFTDSQAFTITVSNVAAQTTTCVQNVTVVDNQPPSISCPANITVPATAGACNATVNYTAPVGTDNCSGATTARIAGPASGSTFAPGVTTITHRVTDGAGNTATCSFTVTVIAGNDNDADGLCDNVDLDDDNDGLLDVTEGGAALDTDGDGVPDRFDLDSDNDGIYDCVESGSAQAFTAGVLNGAITANGIPVSVDANANNVVDYTIRDSDADGTIDSRELDADADGCNDVIEAGYTDVNSDGRLGPAPLTVDGRGLVTSGNN